MWFVIGLIIGYGICWWHSYFIMNKMPMQLKRRIQDWKEAEIAKLRLDLED